MSAGDDVITRVRHDTEDRTYVTGYASAGTYLRRVSYISSSSRGQLKSLVALSGHCRQHVRVECYAALEGLQDDWMLSVDGRHIPFTDQHLPGPCKCALSKACQQNQTRCTAPL